MMTQHIKKQTSGCDGGQISIHDMVHYYHERNLKAMLELMRSDKKLHEFSQSETNDTTHNRLVEGRYSELKQQTHRRPEMHSLLQAIFSSHDGAELFPKVAREIASQRGFKRDDLEYHILVGSTPAASKILDLLKDLPTPL
ncbi:MAG: hypothetical protein KKD39_00535 [Candidatus Altiarchaeota archaeon]|nr:hypothetical protein [Candidatus Altiarchaeota archaeon]